MVPNNVGGSIPKKSGTRLSQNVTVAISDYRLEKIACDRALDLAGRIGRCANSFILTVISHFLHNRVSPFPVTEFPFTFGTLSKLGNQETYFPSRMRSFRVRAIRRSFLNSNSVGGRL
jgi:hypothetical protein